MDWWFEMPEWSFGATLRSRRATASGAIINGTTCMEILTVALQMLISALLPIRLNRIGDIIATARLLTMEYVASRVTLPPNIPVTTGAAVAVGQKMQINVATASSSFMNRSNKYATKAPGI